MYLGTVPEEYDSVVCLTHLDGRPLMVRNRRRAWEFPGGHREPGEDLYATARREAWEEAGATLGEVRVAGYYVLSGGHTTVVTHALVSSLEPLSGEYETVEVRTFDRLPPEQELSWADGLYAHLLRVLGLPGARDQNSSRLT
ncbi:NUDIX domain-containing protein [Nocardiopsis exhalans]|uniref:NUDIX domain-containing protein n=1 Tax=Nocardiopsis exhalans TaxID=163604 RepID=A0ABY5D4X3_9ACTN|nr:NUDIX domain-containing protein [Nocardiopsis exhalans]USY18191.1 NUDIX domain-containing protein [Nocardiopsis exhalans]